MGGAEAARAGSERAALLAWYDREGRDLPWRRTRDPYAIWVSEIMLQQTRVETVIPYWERFMERFPEPAALAAASEDDVLALWSGLGYYRRARMLHAGVREVVEAYGGEVPRDRSARLGLPGVGRYTAGAIGSIAFAAEEPVVDGNVMRVLARLRGIETPLGRRETEDALWREAEVLVRGPRPGDLNQAVMELGARVCVPRRPRCDACPVSAGCVARETDRVELLPVPKVRKRPIRLEAVAVVATRGDRVALRRSDGGLFRGLWGVPMLEGTGREAARAAMREAGVGGRLAGARRASVEHALSHRHLVVEVWRASGASAREGAELVRLGGLGGRGISTLTQKLIAAAGR